MPKPEAGNTQRFQFICYLDYYRVPPPKALGLLRKNSGLFQGTKTRPIKAKMVSVRRVERSAVEGRAERLGDLHEARVYHQAYKYSLISSTSFVKTTQASITTAVSTSSTTRTTSADAPPAFMRSLHLRPQQRLDGVWSSDSLPGSLSHVGKSSGWSRTTSELKPFPQQGGESPLALGFEREINLRLCSCFWKPACVCTV